MGKRRRIRKFIIIIIALVNFIFCNVEYAILSAPKNSLMLAGGKSLLSSKIITSPVTFIKSHKSNTANFQTSILQYPADIYLFNIIYNNQFSFSLIDIGTLKDKINNVVLNETHAYEFMLEYFYEKSINRRFKYFSNLGIIYSEIGEHSSSAFISNHILQAISYNYNFDIALSINNLGLVINNYFSNKEYLNPIIQLGIIKNYNKFLLIGYDYKYHNNKKLCEHLVTLQYKLNNHISLLASINSNRDKLVTQNKLNNLLSSLSFGGIINYNTIDIAFGLSYLGPSGYIYGITFKIK